MAKKKKKKKRAAQRRAMRALLMVVAVMIALLGILLLLWGVKRVISSGNDAGSSVTTTAPTTTTTTTATVTQPTALYVDGHYVQQSIPSWNLQLVNGWNALPDGYDYEANLIDFGGGQMFDSRAATALRQMLDAGAAYGLRPVSLFRSYELQTSLFTREVNEWKALGYSQTDAEAKAATVVARPGTSEHHMGLAADILSNGVYSLEESFENTDAFAWLKAHCAEYGFILRYPKEKEDVTGVIYEPWHYRYVGVEIATEIMSRSITLEEYLAEVYK